MKEAPLAAPWLFALARVFEKAGQPLYLVGGGVRNPLMGLPISDVDVCGPALPKEAEALCAGTEVRAHLRAAHFGTVELHLSDGQGKRHMAEYTTFREDSYRCGHQPSQVRFTKDLAVDALRRDFSVNALYREMRGTGLGEVLDPTGGLSHLAQGVLHTVTADPDQVLKDDGLRILRAARFQAELGLAPTEALLGSARKHVSLLQDIARERLHDELLKILLADFRYPGLARQVPATASGLLTVKAVGAWEILWPELPYEEERVGLLGRLAVPEGALPIAARLAFLFWDAPATALERELRSLHFAAQEIQQALVFSAIMQRLLSPPFSAFAAAQGGLPGLLFAQAAFALLAEAGDPRRRAAFGQATGLGQALLGQLQKEGIPCSLRELAVNGNDLLPLFHRRGASPKGMGELLSALWQACVEERLENRREALLRAAEDWLGQGG